MRTLPGPGRREWPGASLDSLWDGPAPTCYDSMLRNLPRQKALIRDFYTVWGPSFLPLSVGNFSLYFLRGLFPSVRLLLRFVSA